MKLTSDRELDNEVQDDDVVENRSPNAEAKIGSIGLGRSQPQASGPRAYCSGVNVRTSSMSIFNRDMGLGQGQAAKRSSAQTITASSIARTAGTRNHSATAATPTPAARASMVNP